MQKVLSKATNISKVYRPAADGSYTLLLVVRLLMIALLTFIVPLIFLMVNNRQAALALFCFGLVVTFVTVLGYALTKNNKNPTRLWTAYAIADGFIIILASFFVAEFFNVFLVLILLAIVQIHRKQRIVVLTAAGLTVVPLLVHFLIALNLFAGLPLLKVVDQVQFAFVSYVILLATSGIVLTTIVRRYIEEIDSYEKIQQNSLAEMAVAHEIQSSLMAPREVVNGTWQIAAISVPAKEVGGDFYEYVPYLGSSIGGIAIGDVSGKGVPAALQMAVVRTIFRIEARRRIFPGETLMRVNQSLQSEISLGMCTLLYAFIDSHAGVMHFANAGHNYPILINDTVQELPLAGLPLGISEEGEYEENSVKLNPGNTVIFYTDGVVEAMNERGELFGFPRLLKLVEEFKNLGAQELVDTIIQHVQTFAGDAPQSDDITVVILKNNAPVVTESRNFARTGDQLDLGS